MSFDLEEQEKVDELKAWWKQNGSTVLLAVAVFAAIVAGMQGWRYYQKSQQQQAAQVYEAVQSGIQGKDIKRIRALADRVNASEHPMGITAQAKANRRPSPCHSRCPVRFAARRRMAAMPRSP